MWCSIVDIMDPVAATNEIIRNATTNTGKQKGNHRDTIRMVFSKLWRILSSSPEIEPML
jgi:hypothetical protein